MKQNRSVQILELLMEHKKMEVAKLSSLLHVSQVTMRKDLDALETKGLVKRIHGYAQINDTDDINGRLAYHYEEKLEIAKRASELVFDGDTIFIENGSCCALLAEVLAKTKRNLTIVTNSAYIADYIRTYDVDIVLLGGIYQRDSQCLVGPMIKELAQNYNVDYLFIGTDGYSKRTGFTNKDQMRAQAVRDMAGSCQKVIVLTESDKFKAPGTVPLHIKDQPQIVITDEKIPKETLAELEVQKMRVITV